MTLFSFDYYDQNEIPVFYLANPDGTVLYNLGTVYERKLQWRYNALSTLTFVAPSVVDNISMDYYNSIEYRRLVYVDGLGTFMITDVSESNDGAKQVKNVTCQSLETILSFKKLSLFTGTYTFNNVLSGSGVVTNNLMTEILAYIPGWSLGEIDTSLKNITRSFDITDKTLYDFLMNDVATSYQCVFVFDTINKTISAYSPENATSPTDIYISFDNLMKSISIDQSTQEIATAMNVLGGDGISINYVNPLGTNIIYNFDYYKTTDWMTQDLIDALDDWKSMVDTQQPIYANLLTGLRVENTNLITLQSDLTTLEGELASLVSVKDARTLQGLDITEVSASITVVSASITVKEGEISSEEEVIVAINDQLTQINTDLSFETNFTSDQLSSLNNFIIGNTYTNTNFIATSLMSEVDIQNVAQQLYDQSVAILEKISQPRYTFEINMANYLFIKEYQPFIDQTSLGNTIAIQTTSSASLTAVILGIDIDYDNPENFKMILSNRMRLGDSKFQLADFQSDSVDAAVTTTFNAPKWNNTSDSYTSTVGAGTSLVVATTSSNENNIPLFAGADGNQLKDSGAMYLTPTTFTPALTSSGATFTYSNQKGYYGIVGRTLTFEMSLGISSVSGTTTNPVYISMPVLHKDVSGLYGSFRVSSDGVTFGAGYSSLLALLSSNSAQLSLYKEGTGIPLSPMLASAISGSSTNIHIAGQYFIN